ncbi:MAG: hypothetical protein WAL38_29310 [Solirubrobacteraceae bacterium]
MSMSEPVVRFVKLAAVACGVGLIVSGPPVANLIQKAAGINGSAQGLGQIVNTVNSILTPVLVTSAAIGTLALVAGGAALMLGHPRAIRLLGGVVAGLILIGGAKGIIA